RRGYYYRRRPERDSELDRIDRRHFDVLDQWDRIVTDRGADASPWLRELLFDRMVTHATYVLETRIRHLDDDIFAEFFDGLCDRFEAHRPQPAVSVTIGGLRSRAIE